MNKLAIFGALLSGAAIGSVVTWAITKKKYEEYAQEEIDSVKKSYCKMEAENEVMVEMIAENLEEKRAMNNEIEKIATQKAEAIINDYEKNKAQEIIKEQEYASYTESVIAEKEREGVSEMKPKPYVISPEEFDDNIDHDIVTLTWYADGTLVEDVSDTIITDIEGIVGRASLDTFGQYEKDTVYVRNERLGIDYEILLDDIKYADMLAGEDGKYDVDDEYYDEY